MLFKVPVRYVIAGVKKGNIGPAKYYFEETLTAEVTEISPDSAPVAIEWTPYPDRSANRYWHSDLNASGPDWLQLTRWSDGRHWKRMTQGDLNFRMSHCSPLLDARSLAGFMSETQDAVKFLRNLGMRSFEGKKTTKWKFVDGDPSEMFSSIVVDGREQAVESVSQCFSNLMSVNGIIHRASIEPYASVSELRLGPFPIAEIGVETKEETRWNVGQYTTHTMFSLRNWDDAIEKALGSTGRKERLQTERVLKRLKPRILIGESLSWDWDVLQSVSRIVSQVEKRLAVVTFHMDKHLQRARVASSVDEQFSALSSIESETISKWERWGVSVDGLRDALELLEDHRPVAILPDQPRRRPSA